MAINLRGNKLSDKTLFFFLLLTVSSLAQPETNNKSSNEDRNEKNFCYTNPITRDSAIAMRDHFIIKVNEQWFCTGTSLPVWTGPNPGVRLLVSDDLIHWKHHSWIIDAIKLPDDSPYKRAFLGTGNSLYSK